MADIVMLRGLMVLGVHVNRYTPKGQTQEKIYRTAFTYLPGPEEGKDKPQLIDLSVEDDLSFAKIKSMVGKSADLVADKQTFRDSERYTFIGTLSEFLKGAA